jgi:hypothetical protein
VASPAVLAAASPLTMSAASSSPHAAPPSSSSESNAALDALNPFEMLAIANLLGQNGA